MTRKYSVATPAQIKGKTGLEVLRACVEGELPAPPIAQTMNFDLVEVAHGFAAFEAELGAHLLNPLGIVHGGFALTLVDSACGCAAHTTLPADVGYTTVETKVNFTRAMQHDGGRIRCEGRVINAGRSLITADARLTLADGTLAAHGTSTIMVLGRT